MNEFDLVYELDLNAKELEKIQKDYGSVSELCRRYVMFLQGDRTVKIKVPEFIRESLTNYFDLSNVYSMGENSGYAQLLADILKIRLGFFTYGSFEEIINSAMDEVLSEQDKDIVRAFYNLDGKGRDVSQLEDIYDMTAKDLVNRKQRCVKRILAGRKSSQLQLLSRLIVDSAIAEEVLPEFIETKDAITETDYSQSNERKLKLAERVLSREIDYIVFTGDLNYIFHALEVKTKISNSILSEEKKKELLDNVDEKIKNIAAENREAIIALFMDRIRFFMHDEQELRRYKSLKKDVINSGLDEDAINMITSKLPEIKNKPGKSYGIFKRDLMVRLQFPQSELTVDQMPLKGRCLEVFKRSGLLSVEQIISFSKNELANFAGLSGLYISEMMEELEHIGYDIPEDDSTPIENYNYDKLHEDRFPKIAGEIQELEIDSETKSELMSMVLNSVILRLKREYDRLDKMIRTYKDIFWTHQSAKIETADEERYRRKAKEAEIKRAAIKKKLALLER